MDSRSLICKADKIARGQGLTQAQWSAAAGHAINGQTVSRVLNKGDCRVSTLQDLLRPLGYELEIIEVEDMP